FFADSEISSVRSGSLNPSGNVGTIVGKGLFDFGDVDGVGDSVRLQHPLGVVYVKGSLYVADTYNHKIKQINLNRRDFDVSALPEDTQQPRREDAPKYECRTFAGTRDRGTRDGDRKHAQFNEPGGISATSKA